jgi:hypothetical protein
VLVFWTSSVSSSFFWFSYTVNISQTSALARKFSFRKQLPRNHLKAKKCNNKRVLIWRGLIRIQQPEKYNVDVSSEGFRRVLVKFSVKGFSLETSKFCLYFPVRLSLSIYIFLSALTQTVRMLAFIITPHPIFREMSGCMQWTYLKGNFDKWSNRRNVQSWEVIVVLNI